MSNELYKAVEQFLIARDAWEGNPAVTSETPGVALDHLRSVFANARASTPESITHPDATTEWKSPHDPSDCQVTCPVHLRWADEVAKEMGPGYIRTQAERAAEKICAKLFAEIFSPAGKGGLSTSTEAEIAAIIESEFTTPCPDCEQARATNDTPGFYLDDCEKHRAPASPITVPAEMTKEEMQHEANFLKLQEMRSDGTISRFEYERGLEQNDAEFRAALPTPAAEGDTGGGKQMKCRLCGRTANEIQGYLHRVNEKGVKGIWECRPICGAEMNQDDALLAAIEGTFDSETPQGEAEVPQFTLERLDMLERQFKGMAHGSLIAEMCRALRATALSATTATQGVVQLLDAALVHPESAEGHIRQVIEMLSVRARLSSESGKAPYIGTCQKCRKVSEYMMHGWCSECIYRLITVARSEQAQPDTPAGISTERRNQLWDQAQATGSPDAYGLLIEHELEATIPNHQFESALNDGGSANVCQHCPFQAIHPIHKPSPLS